jgi:hypothetical protein
MDLDAGRDAADVGEPVRQQRDAGLLGRVRDPVRQEGLDAAVGHEDLEAAQIARGRVAVLGGRQVLPQLARDARQCSEAEHR